MKWQCTSCDEIWLESELLSAPNPFEPAAGPITGCPHCKEVNCFRTICDWTGCKRESSSGTPLADGRYVWRCWDHRPEAVGEKINVGAWPPQTT